ncbi:MAG: SDR family NAD(P)-dependent oxidoreductase [Planctomycetota bacterium]
MDRGSAVARVASLHPAQKSLWLRWMLGDPLLAYHLAVKVSLRGALDQRALGRAIAHVVAQHEALRTHFSSTLPPRQHVREHGPAAALRVVGDAAAPAAAPEVARACAGLAAEPFDLGPGGDLVRWSLFALGPDHHVLSVTASHLVLDAKGLELLLRELGLAYQAAARGEVLAVDRARRQPADAVPRASPRDLVGTPPARVSSPLVPPHRTGVEHVEIGLPLADVERLFAVGAARQATPFQTLLAVVHVLLARHSGGAEAVVVHSATDGRDPADADVVGMFTGLLAVSTAVSSDALGGSSFAALLETTRANVLDALAGDAPSVPPSAASWRCAFAFEEPVLAPGFGGALAAEVAPVPLAAAKFDLLIAVRRQSQVITAVLEFDPDRLDRDRVGRMAEHLAALVAALGADPRADVHRVPMLTAAERALHAELAVPAVPAPGPPIPARVAAALADAPSALAIDDGTVRWSRAELAAQASRVAAHLAAAGVRPGARVAIALPRSGAWVAALLGTWRLGAAYVALDPDEPTHRRAVMLRAADAAACITREECGTGWCGLTPSLTLTDLASCPAVAEPAAAAVGDEAAAYVVFTSGSTGTPKGVVVSHGALRGLVQWHLRTYQLAAGDRVAQTASPGFDAAGWELWPALAAGASLHLPRDAVRNDPRELWSWLAAQRIGVAFAATPVCEGLLATPRPAALALRALLTGGGRLHAPPREALPFALVNHYGPSECTVVATCAVVTPGRPGAPPIGRPIDGVGVRLVDGHDQPVPVGAVGEIVLSGPALADGYLGAAGVDGFAGAGEYRTGDRASLDASGVLHFVGRIDEQVELRGLRVELGEVDAAVAAAHPAVKACAAVRQGENGAARLVAYLEMEPTAGSRPDPAALRAAAAARLPAAMVPTAFVVLDRLPRLRSGKVHRAALTRRSIEQRRQDRGVLPPQTATEAKIAEIWGEVLHRPAVARDESFFEIGGDSLSVVRVRALLRERIGVVLPIEALFQYPTVATLAERIDARAPAAAVGPAPVRPASGEPIAIVGMAGRFPGAADVDAFWRNLRAGIESVSRFSRDELLAAGCDPCDLAAPDYVPARAIVAAIDQFDAGLFGLSPRDARLMDPQLRLLLEAAWSALQDAGIDPRQVPGVAGVYVGCGANTYAQHHLARHRDTAAALDEVGTALLDSRFAAMRIAHALDLTGPAVQVWTACSTALVAVHQACQALRAGECSLALAGAASLVVPQKVGYRHRDHEITAPDGHCRPFDAAAAGTVGGEGLGLLVLKPLGRAQRDGDRIRAVLRGSAVTNDGARKVGFTAPNVAGQSAVIRAALADAGVAADTISYVEAHGTGTALGDPIEVAALAHAFRAAGAASAAAWLGSVKSNIGHLDTAAGIAGLIKTVLALEEGAIPPTLHFAEANPEIDFARTPFRVADRLVSWRRDAVRPRRAGVSSFGFGGTNAHVIVEEAPSAAPTIARSAGPAAAPPGADHAHRLALLTLSASSPAALDRARADVAAMLDALDPASGLAGVARACQDSRSGLRERCVVVCREPAAAAAALRGARVGDASVATATAARPDAPVAAVLPSSGGLVPGLGAGLYREHAPFRASIDRGAAQLRRALGVDLRDVLYPADPGAKSAVAALAAPRWAEPALVLTQLALARQWEAFGIAPSSFVGHGAGELAAATLAGVFEDDAALELAVARGALLEALPAGALLGVALAAERLEPLLLDGLTLAAIHGPRRCVVAGVPAAVERLAHQLRLIDVPAEQLRGQHPLASPELDGAAASFAARVATSGARPPRWAWLSTVTGGWVGEHEGHDPGRWAQSLAAPVQLAAALDALLDDPARVILELGPGRALDPLVRQHPRGRDRALVSSMRHPTERADDAACLLGAVGQLWLAGVRVQWRGVHGGAVPPARLPEYPFERQSYWIEPDGSGAGGTPAAPVPTTSDPVAAGAAEVFYAPAWRQAHPVAASHASGAGPWLIFADQLGVAQALARRVPTGEPVAWVRPGDAFARVGDHEYRVRPGDPSDVASLWQSLRRESAVPRTLLHLWGVTEPGSAPLRVAEAAAAAARLFGSLAALARTAAELEPGQPLRVVAVTNGLHAVLGDEAHHPERALLLGPCHVAAHENPQLVFINVDLSPEPTAVELDGVLPEAIAGVEPVVARRGSRRWVRGFEQVWLDRAAAGPVRGAWLVTGGFGGIGMAAADVLLSRGAAGVVLVGRRGAAAAGDAAWRELERKARQLGARVQVAAGDVRDAAWLRAIVARAEAEIAPLRGVVHSAGLSTGGTLALRTASAWREVLAAKVDGTLALREVLGDRDLDWVLLCSSLTSLCGGVGSADYGSANAFLDAFAATHDTRWRAVTAVNWDAWSESGMALGHDLPPGLRAARAADLRDGIGDALGRDILDHLLDARPTQVIASRALRGRLPRVERPARPAPRKGARREIAAGRNGAAPATAIAQTAIAQTAARLLGADAVDADDNLLDLGMDSLLGHRLIRALRRDHALVLSLRTVLETPTPRALAAAARRVGPTPPGVADAAPGPAGAPHPLLGAPVVDGDPGHRFVTTLSAGGDWVLGEHLLDGRAVLPGTAYLELACAGLHAALGATPHDAQAIEIRDLTLVQPLAAAGSVDARATVHTTLVPDAEGWSLTIASGVDGSTTHAVANVRTVTVAAAAPCDLDALEQRCGARQPVPPSAAVDSPLSLGPRWRCVRATCAGRGAHETATWLALDPQHATADSAFLLHPALLDAALGLRGPAAGVRRLPFAYDRILVRAPLPPEIVSWLRYRPSEPGGDVVVDARILDPAGRPVLEIDGLRFRAISSAPRQAVLRGRARAGLTGLFLAPGSRRAPQPGEVEIAVRFAAVNFKDVLAALGKVPLHPGGLGLECAGTVTRVGDGAPFAPGDEVVALAKPGFARWVCAPAATVARRPDPLSLVEAATLPVAYLTAWHALRSVGRIGPGERVLVLAAAGGVGMAAVHVARAASAEVIAAAGSRAKRSALRALGLPHVVDGRDRALADTVRSLTAGRGVDVALGAWSDGRLEAAAAALAPHGRLIDLATPDLGAAGPAVAHALAAGASIAGVQVGTSMPGFAESWRSIMAAAAAGQLPPLPRQVFGWRDAAAAFERLTTSEHVGRVLLEVEASC